MNFSLRLSRTCYKLASLHMSDYQIESTVNSLLDWIPGSEPDADHEGVARKQRPLVDHAVLAHVVDGVDGLVGLVNHGDDNTVVRAGVALQLAAAEAVPPALGNEINDNCNCPLWDLH